MQPKQKYFNPKMNQIINPDGTPVTVTKVTDKRKADLFVCGLLDKTHSGKLQWTKNDDGSFEGFYNGILRCLVNVKKDTSIMVIDAFYDGNHFRFGLESENLKTAILDSIWEKENVALNKMLEMITQEDLV